jgi:hypothetical protein
MKKQVRNGAFETNSSSTHSICIASGETTDTLQKDDKYNAVIIESGEFGWEVEDYWDARSKAAYCYTYAVSRRDDSKAFSEDKNLYMLRKVISEHTGHDVKFEHEVNIENKDSWYPYGYIDHQSMDVPEEAFESEESLKQFIFNRRSILHTDNDNY